MGTLHLGTSSMVIQKCGIHSAHINAGKDVEIQGTSHINELSCTKLYVMIAE